MTSKTIRRAGLEAHQIDGNHLKGSSSWTIYDNGYCIARVVLTVTRKHTEDRYGTGAFRIEYRTHLSELEVRLGGRSWMLAADNDDDLFWREDCIGTLKCLMDMMGHNGWHLVMLCSAQERLLRYAGIDESSIISAYASASTNREHVNNLWRMMTDADLINA